MAGPTSFESLDLGAVKRELTARAREQGFDALGVAHVELGDDDLGIEPPLQHIGEDAGELLAVFLGHPDAVDRRMSIALRDQGILDEPAALSLLLRRGVGREGDRRRQQQRAEECREKLFHRADPPYESDGTAYGNLLNGWLTARRASVPLRQSTIRGNAS